MCTAILAENVLALPVLTGRKTDKEKFAGARATYSMEAMMQDGKALQAGTTHNFGTNFSEAYGIQFLSKEGKLEYAHETSWGTSTRLIGAIVMTHGDERGLKLPPRVAPIPGGHSPHRHAQGRRARARPRPQGRVGGRRLRVELDDRDTYSAGWKFNEWEMKGVPVRLELGPRDIENGVAMSMRRDTLEKKPLELAGIADTVKALLDDIHTTMFEQARAFRDAHIYTATTLEALEKGVQNGFVKAAWCGCRECEDKVKELYNASTRNMPFDQSDMPSDKCVVCGKPAEKLIYFAKAY